MSVFDFDSQFLRNLGIAPLKGESMISETTVRNQNAALEVADTMLTDAIQQFLDNGQSPAEIREVVEQTLNELGEN